MRTLILGTGVHRLHFNTIDPSTGGPITLAGTPSCRSKVNGGASVSSGHTLTVDVDGITGKHELELDIDNGTLALADGDEVHPYIHAGTVGGQSVAGIQPSQFEDIVVVEPGLTAEEIADVETAVDDALTAYFGTTELTVADDAGNSATSFEVEEDVGADVRTGHLRLTSGALAGESRLVSHTGTTVTVLAHSSMPAALKQFSAEPAAAVTGIFKPL